MHITRHNTSKRWPIPRKGTKYLVFPSRGNNDSIPLLIIMREILGIVKTRKELKKILNENKILVNGRIIKEDKTSLALFDVISIGSLNKNYKLIFSDKGKFSLVEIKDNEASSKICKIIGKNMLKEKKIEKILPVKEKSKVLIIKGKHLGDIGEIISINNNKITVKNKEREFETVNKEVIVIN